MEGEIPYTICFCLCGDERQGEASGLGVDPENGAVVSNITAFLPDLFGAAGPMEYRCEYADGKLAGPAAGSLGIAGWRRSV